MKVRPGPIRPWNRWPAVFSGPTGPLEHGFPAQIETPDVQREGVGELVTFRAWGFPVGWIPPELAEIPPEQWPTDGTQAWGLGDHSKTFDQEDKHQNPGDATERVRPFEVQRCVPVSAAEITLAGVARELVHFEIPEASVGVLERIPTIFEDITALDAGGLPIFSFGNLNGERPCITSLAHPDPLVGDPLTWQFHLTRSHVPAIDRASTGTGFDYGGTLPPTAIEGTYLLPPWTDLRYGTAARWGDQVDIVVPARALARVWVVLRGPTHRFRVTVGARIAGYWQSAGRKGAALETSLHRYAR